MSQEHLSLVLLITIIVGIATVVAVNTFKEENFSTQRIEEEKIIFEHRRNTVRIIEYETHEYLIGLAPVNNGIAIEHSASCKSREHR